ncbi:hypothetical protein UA32_12665 [Photobacterium angustum]|uniref:Uncharacterized protein n=1 Tax=Photobacterium angustum TaxID=661 RepID=A0ABX5H150_PHOAN|nr:hypothetical protein [Photobacterium angustum]KJG37796.1 hypothetical protein UA32_12665 [Photobacterium angustum]PSX07067.1 hypothetical protein C0W27_15980 [Photobacterium angustum]
MFIKFKGNRTVNMKFILSLFVFLSPITFADDLIVSKIITKHHETTYRGSEVESIESMKESVKSKFKSEFIDLLPSYVHSVKSIGTTGYDQNIRFVVGSLIDIQNENYEFENVNDTPVVTLSANVQFDELELQRNIKSLKKNNENIALIQSLINNDSLMQNKIQRIKMLYGKKSDLKFESTIDDQLKTLVKLQQNNQKKVTLLFADNIKTMVEHDRKKSAIAKEEARFKAELAQREKTLNSLSLMNNAELKAIEASSFYAKALHDYYIAEMTSPRTLRVKSSDANSATFEVVRVDGKPVITPWKYSFDVQLASLYDRYPFAKFSHAQTCDLDYYESNNDIQENIDGFASTLKPNGQFGTTAPTGITAGRFGSHKPIDYVPLGKNLIKGIASNFNTFSPKFNSPYLYYYADNEMRVHHVDPTANGIYSYSKYAYKIDLGSRTIELPFVKRVKKKNFESKHYTFNVNFVMGRDVVIAPYITPKMLKKERYAFRPFKGKSFTADRTSLKQHSMDPQTPLMTSCNDEFLIENPTLTLTNTEIASLKDVKISVIKIN